MSLKTTAINKDLGTSANRAKFPENASGQEAEYKPLIKHLEPSQKEDHADKVFKQVKTRFTSYAWGAALLSGLGLIPFVLKSGLTVPARALQVVGDFFGSAASLSAPFALITNEIKNHKKLLGLSNGNGNGDIFDKVREAFYRCCSLGFTPFIFEPFLNPEKFGKSPFHKIATYTNIPNLIFTGFAWGFGNFQSLLAWGLREVETKKAKNLTGEQKEKSEATVEGLNRIYNSAKRLATIGSIANPTMQGLRQCADSLALLTGYMSPGEFFERPLLGVSRLVSLFVGLPEYFIKGMDSAVRVLDERKHLEPVLPDFVNKRLNSAATYLDSKIKTPNGGLLKSIRHSAEVLFHTLSPLSMFALFTPMLDERCTSDEAQSRGGITGLLDKTIGRSGKLLTILFTGSYVLFARLPQTVMQVAYYGQKVINKKFYNKETTKEEAEALLKNKIANSFVVDKLSKFAKTCINFLVGNYYTAEHQHSYLTFEQITASDSFDQAKEEYKHFLKKGVNITPELENEIVNYCIKYAQGDAIKSYHKLTDKEISDIKNLVINKIKETVNPASQIDLSKPKLKPKFPGAYFLATYIFRLFDIKERILNTDCTSDHRNMKTVYKREELDLSFEGELYPVLTECVQGLRRTVNLVQGVAN